MISSLEEKVVREGAVRVYVRVAAFLGAMLLITWGARTWQLRRVSASVERRQAAAMRLALSQVERDFAEMQGQLLSIAHAVAEAPEVIRNLRQYRGGDGFVATEALVRYMAALEKPPRVGMELYDPTPRLIAWNGFSMPPDAAPSAPRFLEAVQTAIVRDGDKRVALAVWWPVRAGARVLGAVRVMRLLYFDAPVRNRYLRDYSLDEVWTRMAHLPIHVDYDDVTGEPRRPGATRLLQGTDGTPLARIYVEPPAPEDIVAAERTRFDDVMALWATLLGFWLMAGLWQWHRQGVSSMHEKAPLGPMLGRFALAATAWGGLRFALLVLNVPARWQTGKSPFAPLFDPQHLASTFGGGLMRSTGDLFLTALFAVFFAAALLHLSMHVPAGALTRRKLRDRVFRRRMERGSPARLFLVTAMTTLLIIGLAVLLGLVTKRAILDSTLNYFARTGLLPENLVLLVYGALLLMTLAAALLAVGLVRLALGLLRRGGPIAGSMRVWVLVAAFGVALPVGTVYLISGTERLAPWVVTLVFLAMGAGGAAFVTLRKVHLPGLLTLRSVLFQAFVLAVLLYPLVYDGLDAQRRLWMRDAAETFEEGDDPRVRFAIEEVLRKADASDLAEALAAAGGDDGRLDSLARALLQGSLLTSLGGYEVGLTLFDRDRTPRGRHIISQQSFSRATLDEIDTEEFELLREMVADSSANGPFIERVTGRRRRDRFQYIGFAPIPVRGDSTAGWLFVRAEPQPQFREEHTPFPQVLLPEGYYGNEYADLALAEFRNGVLVRSLGRIFGRYRLPEEVARELGTKPALWREETVREQRFLTYYVRISDVKTAVPTGGPPGVRTTVVAVRTASINTFDHLYYLLRLTVAGLFLALPVYLFGLFWRRRAGLLPAPRVHFRDKVLNAFFAVGIITAAAMGFAGLQVVTGENERAIQSWLQQHLERVEETLARQARGDELPYRVLARTHVDSLALLVGLDLNIYQDARLVATSRPQLIHDRLLDRRLPISAYQDLYFDGFRFSFTEEEVGSFTFTAGFRALADERGAPRYVISVPTLPEQERIEEERARTVAYLFGALLLLVLVVVLTAGLLANALARPIARLREGLEAVAQGRFERIRPIGSRDEIGELVETFNAMQEQLAESRRKLAQQERQLAWSEMARQVAHEIKNPLTPMKLSVQHLLRAYDDLLAKDSDQEKLERFRGIFERITGTLFEQVNALKRIADEFSTFARMPTRMMEPLDLNAVIREAVALMQEEAGVEIVLDLHPGPLVLEADREELRRIFINLIKNAFQAIPPGASRHLEIATEKQVENGRAYAYGTVTDTGVGIPPELHSRIFEPNFSTKTSGTGLGLAIVKKSVEALSGEIGFETEVGVGTTFWVRLPLKG
jgi:signal transduction histidine kinase